MSTNTLDPVDGTAVGIARRRLSVNVGARALAAGAGVAAFAAAVSGFGWAWAGAVFAGGGAVVVLALVPGFELMSGVAVLGLFVSLAVRMYAADLSVSRALLIGLLLLGWALLAQLGEALADEPATRPVRLPLLAWVRQAVPLLVTGVVAGAAAAVGAAAANSTALRIGGTVAIVLAVVAPMLLLVALLFAWRWRDPGNRPPVADDDPRY